MQKKKSAWALPVCFFLLITVLTVCFFVLPKESFSESEKRPLTQRPQFSFAALLDGSLTAQAESYVTDHFPFRKLLVGLYAYARQSVGQNGDGGVWRGKNGWLFTVQGNVDLKKEADNVRRVRAFAARNGLETTWLLVPCAGFMLPNELPRFCQSFRDGEMLETAKRAVGDDLFLDVRDVFGAESERFYYKTDHHLTAAGSRKLYDAYCAAKRLQTQTFRLDRTSEGFFGSAYSKSGLWLTKPDTLEVFAEDGGDYTVTITEGAQSTDYDSLYFPAHLKQMDQYPVFLDGNHARVTIRNNRCHNGKRVLVLKDSFAHCFATFLAANYETLVLVDLRYDRASLQSLIEAEGLQELLVLYGAENFATATDFAWLSLP